MDELLSEESLFPLLANPYGNYVVQKVLEHTGGERRERLIRVSWSVL